MKVTTKIARLINDEAATHSKLIKVLGISRMIYYDKLKGIRPFTDMELRKIAFHSTISYRKLKEVTAQ